MKVIFRLLRAVLEKFHLLGNAEPEDHVHKAVYFTVAVKVFVPVKGQISVQVLHEHVEMPVAVKVFAGIKDPVAVEVLRKVQFAVQVDIFPLDLVFFDHAVAVVEPVDLAVTVEVFQLSHVEMPVAVKIFVPAVAVPVEVLASHNAPGYLYVEAYQVLAGLDLGLLQVDAFDEFTQSVLTFPDGHRGGGVHAGGVVHYRFRNLLQALKTPVYRIAGIVKIVLLIFDPFKLQFTVQLIVFRKRVLTIRSAVLFQRSFYDIPRILQSAVQVLPVHANGLSKGRVLGSE